MHRAGEDRALLREEPGLEEEVALGLKAAHKPSLSEDEGGPLLFLSSSGKTSERIPVGTHKVNNRV